MSMGKELQRWVFGGLSILLATLMAGVAYGQEIEVQAPQSLYEGQQFQVSFVLPGKPKEFHPPEWGKVKMLFGPAVGSTRQMTVINGKVSQSTSYTYSYVCRADEVGDLTIGAARAEMEKGRITSEPFVISVLSTGASATPGGGGGVTGDDAQGRGSNRNTAAGKDAFVTLELNKSEAYVGQAVLATVKIYTRLDLVGFDDIKFPSFDGFWVKEIPTPAQVSFSRTVVDGKEYNVGVLRSYLLYPQKVGVQKLDGLEAVVQYRVRERSRSFFEEFMGSYSTSSIALRGATKQLNVKALPAEGKPSGFAGAVGKFSASSKVDKEELETNDAVTYTITVEGVGNMHALVKPDIAFPNTVEAYDPVVKENYSVKGADQTGRITYEYVLIPRAPGDVVIPEYDYSYFNPSSGKYETSKVKGYTLHVTPGQGGGAPVVVSGGGSKEDVQVLGNDIRHIHSTRGNLYTKGESFTGGMLYLWWIVLLVLATLGTWVYLSKKQRMEADGELLRDKRASGLAKKRLRRAKELMDREDEGFYAELLRALWGYLGDKLHLEQHELSSESVGESLRIRGVPEEQVTAVHDAIAECEYARYGVRDDAAKTHESYERALAVISELDAWLKRGGSRRQKKGK